MRVYSGPNEYSARPVVVMEWIADAGLLGADLAALEHRVRQAYPGWLDDCPSVGGLPSSHAQALIAAHWAKGLLNSVRGLIDVAGAATSESGRAVLWVGYHVPDITVRAIHLSLEMLSALSSMVPGMVDAALKQRVATVQSQCRQRHPDYVARMLMLAARADDLPVQPSPAGHRFWQYGWGCRSRTFLEASPATDGILGHRLARDKVMVNGFLRRLGFPATDQWLAKDLGEATAHAHRMGWPVVIKPADSGQGRGVTVGIGSDLELAGAFAAARRHSPGWIIVERVVEGFDHRLLVLRGRLIGATRREPPAVVGDGVHSVGQLVDALNRDRSVVPMAERFIRPVEKVPAVRQHLAAQGLDFDSVPAGGQRVPLRGNANLSTGGIPTFVLPQVHPDIRAMAESIAANVDLDCVGIDYITTDISRSCRDVRGAVVEINATPGIDAHIADGQFSAAAIGKLVLGPGLGRIPVVVVIGSTARQAALVDPVMRRAEAAKPGWALVGPTFTTIGAYRFTDPHEPVFRRAAKVLSNGQCTSALLMVQPNEIATQGFPVDRCALAIWLEDEATPESAAALAVAARCARQMVVVDAGSDWPVDTLVEQLMAGLNDPV